MIIVLSLTLASCGLLGKKQKEKPVAIPPNEEGELQILIHDGDSSQPVYNADGGKILFVSRKRPSHAQAQAYELNVQNGNLRRITFQNGDVSSPRYTPDGQAIVYASTTDEVKETPSFLKKEGTSALPAGYQSPAEIYFHSLRAFDITRLTTHNGFDGEEHFISPREISFTRVEAGKTKIMSQSLSGKPAREIKDLGVNPTQYTVSPDGKNKAWIEWDKDFAIAHLRLQVGADKAIELDGESLVDKSEPSFSPDSKYLVWAQRNETRTNGNLWFTDLAKICPREILPADPLETRRQAVISPDMKWLLFATEKEGGSRIARAGFKPAEHSCPAPK